MSIKHLLAFVVLLGLFITSCSETKTESKYANWRERNEHFMDSVTGVFEEKLDPGLFRVQDQRDLSQYIYYKVIESGDQASELPNLTSEVNVFYKGMMIDEAIIGELKSPYLITTAYKYLPVFDGNFTGANPQPEFENPVRFKVNTLVNGFTEILQHMHIGDRWEVYIPYQSGYGSQSSGAVLSYSTLIFDLTLVDIPEL